MRTPTYRELIDHPELIDALHAQARRERAQAFERLVLAPVKAMLPADRTRRALRALKYHRA
jgi:hypothetical protein